MQKLPLAITPIFLTTAFLLPAKAQEGELTMVTPLPFKGVAKLVTKRQKTKKMELRAVYPQFLQSTPVTRLANWKLRVGSQTRYRKVLDQIKKDEKEGFQAPGPYVYDELPSLHYYYAPRLISAAYSYYHYAGGAHGFGATVATNFGQFPGMAQPKQLSLGDFFSGTTYRKTIEKKLIAALRAKKDQEATWILDGTVKSFTPSQLNNFTVSSKGLTWTFPPYDVGPYAAGEFEVTLPYSQLTSDFKRSVVLGR